MELEAAHALVDGSDPSRVEHLRDCRLCGAAGRVRYEPVEDRLFGVPGSSAIWECPACGLLWLSPRFRPEHIGLAYQRYFTHGGRSGPVRLARLRRRVNDLVLSAGFGTVSGSKRAARLMGRLLLSLPLVTEAVEPLILALGHLRPGRVLDVGCGDGSLLGRMRTFGWEVAGVEPDAAAAQEARRRFDIPVFAGPLEEFTGDEGGYDVVLASHVIEHVHDPISFASLCHRLVKPGGRMVLLTPNAGSLCHRLFRHSWFHLDPPRHLYLFTAKTLRGCLSNAGVTPSHVRTLAGQGRETWQASRLIRRHGRVPPGPTPLRYATEGLLFAMVEEAVRWIVRDAGEELMVVAGKP